MLTLVVCAKICVDTAQLRVDPESGRPKLESAPLRISTFDENALEEAIRIKESVGARVILLSLADREPPPELLLRALAMGADDAHLVVDDTLVAGDSLATASILAAAIARISGWRLVLCGEGSLDEYNRQVGPRLAEALRVPFMGPLTRLELDSDRARAQRSLEDRTELVSCALPAVVSVSQEINKPRFPAVLQIMAAARRPVVRTPIAELGLADGTTAASLSRTTVLQTRATRDKRRGIPVEGDSSRAVAEKLVKHLREEGLVP